MSGLFPCLGVVGSLAILLGFLAFLRYMKYKETIALAERGLTQPEPKSGKALLRWGIIVTVAGLVLTVGLYFIGFISPNDYPLRLGPWMLGGLVPLFFGIGLMLFHYLTVRE